MSGLNTVFNTNTTTDLFCILFQTGTGLRDTLSRGKQSIAVNLKQPEGISLVKRLCQSADVLVEPYRPGTERLIEIQIHRSVK